MKSPVVKRSIVIDGHKTSVSLKDPFWEGLKSAVSALRWIRLRRSPLHGETQRRSALSVASTARARCSMSPARPNAVHEMLSRPLRLLAETRHHNSGFRA